MTPFLLRKPIKTLVHYLVAFCICIAWNNAISKEQDDYERVVTVWATNYCLNKKGYMSEIKSLEWAGARLLEDGIETKKIEQMTRRKNFTDDAAKAVKSAGGCEKMIERNYEPTARGKVVGIYAEMHCLLKGGYMTEKSSLEWGRSKLKKEYRVSESKIDEISQSKDFGKDASDLINIRGGCQRIIKDIDFGK